MKKLKTKEKILEELTELFAEQAGLAVTKQEMERILKFFADYQSKLTVITAVINTNDVRSSVQKTRRTECSSAKNLIS